eukprot:6254313-Ditylum_brightwellii.AAC.1
MNNRQTSGEVRKQKHYELTFSEVTAPLSSDFKHNIGRGLQNRKWLNMLPQYRNNIVLGQGEFGDGLIIQYGCSPAYLIHYDGCQE